MCIGFIEAALLACALSAAAEQPSEFKPPVQIQAAGQPIDVAHSGLAAPCYADFDGDGVNDLLVGECGGGRLRIYQNTGTNVRPHFEDFTWFQAETKLGRVPFG